MEKNFGLKTRSDESMGKLASLLLGGTTLYAKTSSELDRGIDAISNAIRQCSGRHATLTRVTLASEVRKLTGVEIEKRTFGAVLGLQLRLGQLDSVACAASSGRVFRIFVHQKRIDDFADYLQTADNLLQKRGILEVHELEAILFGTKRWGTWSSAMHVLARLVQKGRARYVNAGTFLWQAEAQLAVE